VEIKGSRILIAFGTKTNCWQTDKLSEEIKKLEIIYQKKIDGLTELKKSVLKQTFDCG
jgi:hypothetical protein